MPSELTIEDDGFANVTIGATTVSVDLYHAFNHLAAFWAAARDQYPDDKDAVPRQIAYNAKLVAFLSEDLGFGAVSERVAEKFSAEVAKAVDALGKA